MIQVMLDQEDDPELDDDMFVFGYLDIIRCHSSRVYFYLHFIVCITHSNEMAFVTGPS